MKRHSIIILLLVFALAKFDAEAQVTLLTEDFNLTSTDSVPANWDNSDYVAGTSPSSTICNYLWKVTDGGVGSTHCASLTAAHTYVQRARLKTPSIVLPQLKDAYVSFSLRNSSGFPTGGAFNLYVSTDGGVTFSTNVLASNVNTGPNWQTYTYNLDAYRGDTVCLVFEGCSSGDASNDYIYYLDDIIVAEKPTCQKPKDLYVQGLMTNSVNLNWLLDDRFGVAPDVYSITLKDANGNVAYYNGSYTNTYPGISFSNLSANTTYTASVRSNCQVSSFQGFSDSVSISFTTLSVPVNPPYYEDFNSISTCPSGSYNRNASINFLPNYAYGNAGNSLRLTTTSENPAFIAFPAVNLRGGDIEMDFLIRREAAVSTLVGSIPFKAGYLTDPSDFEGTFFPLYSGTLDDASWKNIRFQHSDSLNQTTPLLPCIQIDAAFATSVFVDNVTVRTVPSCIRPENLTITNITSDSASLDWTSSAATVLVSAKNLTTSAVTTAVATNHPFTLTGLDSQTRYEVSIAALCAVGDTSDFTLPVTIKTLCATATSPLMDEGFENVEIGEIADCWTMGWFNHPQGSAYKDAAFAVSAAQKHSGLNSISLLRQPAGTVSYLSSYALPIDVAEKYDVKLFVSRENTPTHPSEGISLWITNAPGDTAGGVKLGRINRHYQSEPVETYVGWYEYLFNIPVQGTRYLTIVGYSEGGTLTYFDDIQVLLAPSCRKVSDITEGSATTNSYGISWTAGKNEQQWVVDYDLFEGVALVSDTSVVVNTPSFILQNLRQSTQYTINGTVRALCGPNDTSEAVSFEFVFTTLCTTIDSLPYSTGFESIELNGATKPLPVCWNRINDATGTVNYYPYVSAGNANSGSMKLQFRTTKYDAHANSIYAVLPELNTTLFPINTLRLKFYARKATAVSPNVVLDAPLEIGVMTDPADTNTFVVVDSVLVSSQQYLCFKVSMAGYSGSGRYLAISLTRQTDPETDSCETSEAFIDDLTLEVMPSCLELDGSAVVSEVTATTAKVTINDVTAANGWSYAYGPTGNDVSTMPTADASNGTIIISGLSAATSYDLYVRRACANGTYGVWSEALHFTTLSLAATIPYACGFENATENSQWIFADGDGVTNFVIGSASTAVHNGNYALYASKDNGATFEYQHSNGKCFAYRTLHFDAKGYQIEYNWKATGGEALYDFGRVMLVPVSTAIAGGTGTEYPLDAIFIDPEDKTELNLTAGDQFGWNSVSRFVDMTNRSGDYNLAVMWTNDMASGSTSTPLSVDDINIYELDCIPPSMVVLKDLTSTGVTLSFTQESATQWEVMVDTLPIVVPDSVEAPLYRVTTQVDSIALTGLTPNTDYYYVIRSFCPSGDTSIWTEPETFHTYCLSVNVPYTESFEAVSSDRCWSPLNTYGEDAGIVARTGYKSYDASNSLFVSGTSVVSPEFAVDTFARYMVSGWAMSQADSASFGIGVIVDPNDVSTYENVTDVLLPEAGRWVEFAAYFTILNSQQYVDFKDAKRIVFSPGANSVYFDLLKVELTPLCPRPTEPRVTDITDTSFVISFVDNASATDWVVYANGVPHVVDSTTAVITGLRSATDYVVKVAAACSATDTSSMADCGVIHTACGVHYLPYHQSFETLVADDTKIEMIDPICWMQLNASLVSPYQPSFSADLEKSTEGYKSLQLTSRKNESLFMVMPVFETVQNPIKVSFDVKYMNSTKCGVLKVGYLTDASNAATFVEAGSTVRQTPWTRYGIVIQSLPAGARLAFKYDDDYASYGAVSGYKVYIDNLVVSEVLDCSEPSAAVVSNVTTTTAQVSFTDSSDEHLEWQYVIGTVSTDPDIATPTTVSGNSFALGGLEPETDYYLYLRAVCDLGDYSNWVLTRFSTLCRPFVVTATSPYYDSFEDMSTGDHLGGCYFVTDVKDSYYPQGHEDRADNYDVYYDSRTGSHCLKMTNQVNNAPDGQKAYRQFHLEAGQIYRASVYYRYISLGNRASLLLGSDASNMTTIAYADNEACSGIITTGSVYYYDYHTCWQELASNISVTQTGDYYIAIKAERSPGKGGVFSMYFDDFSVTQLEGCLPTQPTVDSTTTDKAFFHIEDRDTTHDYEYMILHDFDTIVPPTSIAGINDSCGGLNPSTSYRLMVRQRCSDGNYSEWSSADFETACAPLGVFPITQNFESTIFPPACWSQISYGTTNHVWATTANEMFVNSGVRAASVVKKTAGAKVALVTNEMNLSSPYGYYVRFSMYRSISDGNKVDEALHLLYSTVPITSASIAEATEIAVINRNVQLPPVEPNNLTGYYDYEYEIPAGVTGSVWLAFDFHCQDGGPIYIDDVEIAPMPSCVPPKQALTVDSRTMTTATLSIPMNGHQMAEVAYYLTSSPDSLLGTVVTTNGKAVVSGLAASTSYQFNCRYICAEGDTSGWSPFTQTTTMATDCFEPQNLRMCGITNANSASVTWNPAPLAVGYEYVLSKGGVTVDSAVTTRDTLHFTNLDMSSAYTVRVRTICSTDTTAWTTLNFSTTFTTFTMPFICGFEDNVQNLGWQLRNVQSGGNSFVIGQGTARNGVSSIYVSNDGSTYYYDISSTSGADAEALLEMPAGNYYVEYDWLCNGESRCDFGRVFLMPASIQLNEIRVLSFNESLPAGAISLDNASQLNLKTQWQHYIGIVNIPSDDLYKLVVLFANDSRAGSQQPLAVDNFHIQYLSCMPVSSITIPTVNSNDMVAVVSKNQSDVPLEYGYSVYDEADSFKTWYSTDNGSLTDTLRLSALQTNTTYWLYVRHVCDSTNKSPVVRQSFTTAQSSVSVPFVCSFEAGEQSLTKWHTASGGATNYFVMGNSTASVGTNSLYVSNDGTNNYYDTESASWSYAYLPVAVQAGIVGVSYDWNCQGENAKDYARVFFAPSSTTLAGNVQLDGLSSTSLPSNCIPLDEGKSLALSTGWVNNIAEHAFANDNTYLLVVAWRNDATGGANAPVAIDNINVYNVTCPRFAAEDVAVTTTTGTISVSVENAIMAYCLASDASFANILTSGVSTNGSASFTGLMASTKYFLRLRKICGVGDTAAPLTLSIRTDCGARTLYPYLEGFEFMQAGTSARDQMLDDCWIVDSKYANAYHYVNNSGGHGGINSFTVYNGVNADSYQTFGLPEVDTLAGKRLSVWYRNYTGTASTYALLQVGYLSNPADSSSFVLLASAPFNNSGYTEFVYDYPNTVPASARPAFRAVGTHYLYMDDIRISRVVEGETHSESLCHNSPYSGYGFSCPAGSLLDGDTALVRTLRSDVLGTADSVTTVNLHIYPEFLTRYNDTVCAGQPYTKGLWNIPNPTTQVYRYVWQGSQTASGCDSTVYLDLYVQPLYFNIYDTICQGDSLLFDGRQLTTAGDYFAYSVNSLGCNDTTALHLFVASASDTVSATICQGGSYLFEGTYYTTTGFYSVQTAGAHGCPKTRNLDLTVLSTDSTINVSFCKGGNVTVVDTVINSAGTYTLVRPSGGSCNMTYHITATERPVIVGYVTDYACEGRPFTGYGIIGLVVTKDTVVTIATRTWDSECDSITEVTLIYTPAVYGSENATIKSGESYIWNDNSYTKAGNYTDTLFSVVTGCDSIATLHLLVISDVENVTESIHIQIVPNPVHTGISALIYGNFGELDRVELVNAFGQVIDSFVPFSYPVETPIITISGIYYIRLVDASGKTHTEKIIVE